MIRVRKAIIPAAGFGTRFLPFTKASPKEMLPIVDKPVIQFVVEEAVSAGIEEVIFITNSNKRALEDHFDYNFELESRLKKDKKEHLYQQIRSISDMAQFVYVRQKEPKGNGHALLMARELVDDEPFLVMWGDEFLTANPPRARQLIKLFEKTGEAVLTVIEAPEKKDTYKYGYIDYQNENGLCRVTKLIEKPGPTRAPSKLASIGGFVLTKEIFPILETLKPKRGEIWLADAINILCRRRPVYACLLKEAVYYDSGSKFGFLKANLDYGLKHPETREELLDYIRSL